MIPTVTVAVQSLQTHFDAHVGQVLFLQKFFYGFNGIHFINTVFSSFGIGSLAANNLERFFPNNAE